MLVITRVTYLPGKAGVVLEALAQVSLVRRCRDGRCYLWQSIDN